MFRCRSKKTSKLCLTVLCAGNSPVTGEFPAQMASTVENVSIWWSHHEWLWNLWIMLVLVAYRWRIYTTDWKRWADHKWWHSRVHHIACFVSCLLEEQCTLCHVMICKTHKTLILRYNSAHTAQFIFCETCMTYTYILSIESWIYIVIVTYFYCNKDQMLVVMKTWC